MNDRDRRFHEEWLGLAQPIEGLVFSVPVLGDAQIAPEVRPELSAAFTAQLGGLGEGERPFIRACESFFRDFLGYHQAGMFVARSELPKELSFYAPEGGQEIRPSYALGRGPFAGDDLFAAFEEAPKHNPEETTSGDGQNDKYFALIWDLTQDAPNVAPSAGAYLDLDRPEQDTGTWRYPPTPKFERLLRHVEVPIGLLFNGPELRLLYAPAGQSTAHLTFRVRDLQERAGRPVLAALELLLHSRRAYSAGKDHTLEGLLEASRRRQADVTKALAGQVFEAVETLLAGFEAAGRRDCVGERPDWLRAALEAADDHFYQGVLSIVLRLVFLLYSEDSSLLPVEHDFYIEHLSVFGLYERLSHDAGTHPESMHHRFGAYGQLLALFRAVYLGVRHAGFEVPPRRGKLFDPNTYPFLEGGLPDWTAAIRLYEHRAEVMPPTIDDGTIYKVLHQLVVFEGQRLSYKALDVEQIGSVYESLMGYHVVRLTSPAVRLGKNRVWVESGEVVALSPTDRKQLFKEHCGFSTAQAKKLETAIKAAKKDTEAVVEALEAEAKGRRADKSQQRAAPGRLVLQPGEERRRTGSHYTPRSLTETVVKRTLEPLLACLGEQRTAEQILQLKICDPAMGSGAFLVAACRQLADEVVQAWTRGGEVAKYSEEFGDPHLHARRLVAQRCLYGVDKNAAAVELAKLSLWLVTLSKELPFTFLDHALRHGDSLVGLDYNQVRAFHWAPARAGAGKKKGKQGPSGQIDFCQKALQEALDQAIALRQEILELADNEDPAMQGEKRRLLEFSQQSLERIRMVADVCVGAFFAGGKDREREAERVRRLDLAQAFLLGDERAAAELQELAEVIRKQVSPFHWMLEFPEVFFEERPDPLEGGKVNGAALMEAVVGNPPFLGGRQVSGLFGNAYADWLLNQHSFAQGGADYSAHFFRRADTLLGPHGSIGLIATNTIGQGDTRIVGLKPLLQLGYKIHQATVDLAWPGDAAVTVCVVHLVRGRPAKVATEPRLDGRSVGEINSRLRPTPERIDPVALTANSGASYNGCFVRGSGFVLSADERATLLTKSESNSTRILPFIGGEEVNTHPRQEFDRHVIAFGVMNSQEVAGWPDLLEWLERTVKPERDRIGDPNIPWWQFWRPREELNAAIAPLGRCLVTGVVSKHLMFSFQPIGRIFSHKLYVFPFENLSPFAVLQCRIHHAWVWLLSSTMKTDLNYSASDCFDTFPFPQPDPRSVIDPLEQIGAQLYTSRAAFMVDTDQGLTKTYNALKDPSNQEPPIVELRRLHEAMDRAVLDAYGWTDIAVPPFCPSNPAEQAALQAFEDQVIDRLYVLNAERHREELKAGLGSTKGKQGKGKTNKKAPRGKAAASQTGSDAGVGTADGSDEQGSPTPKKAGKKARKGSNKGKPGKGGAGADASDEQGDLFDASKKGGK